MGSDAKVQFGGGRIVRAVVQFFDEDDNPTGMTPEMLSALAKFTTATLGKGATFGTSSATGGFNVWAKGWPKPVSGRPGEPVADRALRWKNGHDTGMSSMFLWAVLMGRTMGRVHYPHDPSDFGRCHRLLELIPEWRPRLGEVGAKSPEWGALVGAWDELTALYLEELPNGIASKLYARMKALLGERT